MIAGKNDVHSMGSAKVSHVNRHLPMADEKKSIKNLIIKPFQSLFQNKKKEKAKNVVATTVTTKKVQPPPKVTPVEKLLENFQKLELEKKEQEEEDEFKNFTVKVVEDDRRSERIDSHSSQDSGFSEKVAVEPDTDDEKEVEAEKDGVLEEDKVLESLKGLEIEDGGEKKNKKVQTVVVSRTPVRRRAGDFVPSVHPYGHDSAESFRQINQINKHTFSGGHVTVNANRTLTDTFAEADLALKKVELTVPQFTQHYQQEECLDMLQEIINKEFPTKVQETPEDILADFMQSSLFDESELNTYVANAIIEDAVPNPIEEFHISSESNFTISAFEEELLSKNENVYLSIFPSPPGSENIPSPMSDSQASYYPSNSEYTFSPELSSPINSDYEKYQDIAQYDEYPSCVSETLEEKETIQKKRERNTSTSSMTMKQFKDLQKELETNFSKKECCQITRKPCKQIFQEHMEKLKVEERNSLCLKVANLDLKNAYGVLHHVLLSLSQGSEQENLQLALFALLCERVLAEKPALFIDDFGLSLIKSAALRCWRRPLLTRYLVQCVRGAMRADAAGAARGRDFVFREIDAQGDNLVIACVRAGDVCADALAELVRREPADAPLFPIHHGNTEGYSALHVACRQHSASSPCLHVAHVLLEHAGADLWRGDVKGGDTALHLAVNSPTCDLQLVMVMFRHVDRKLWKKLAHVQNRSSVTPLEYARCATKATTRQKYPPEVLDFLKKCR